MINLRVLKLEYFYKKLKKEMLISYKNCTSFRINFNSISTVNILWIHLQWHSIEWITSHTMIRKQHKNGREKKMWKFSPISLLCYLCASKAAAAAIAARSWKQILYIIIFWVIIDWKCACMLTYHHHHHHIYWMLSTLRIPSI